MHVDAIVDAISTRFQREQMWTICYLTNHAAHQLDHKFPIQIDIIYAVLC